MKNIKTGIQFALLASVLILISCNRETKKEFSGEASGKLVIFHAGSLALPMKAISDSFNKIYPDVKILSEASGSLASIRKITDLKRHCDILASADYLLIDKLMIPEFATWNLRFAGNEMALVFRKGSRYSESIHADNWFDILKKPEVKYGRSDPNSDPCGYRTVLTLQLAEKYFDKPGLKDELLKKDNKYIRPKEVDLLALLETGTIDYIFIYKSIAIQHNLPYLKLNDSINLSNPELQQWYNTVDVVVAGNKPGEPITQTGEAMVYGLTIPITAENPETASIFISFLLKNGRTILNNMGQSSIKPDLTSSSVKPDFLSDSILVQ